METIKQVQLEKFKYIIEQRLAKQLQDQLAEMPDVEIQQHAHFMTDEIAVQVRGIVWGREMQRQSHRYPADWWQAIKERFAPEWFKRRWPVRYIEITLTARELYPMLSIPQEEHSIVILKDARWPNQHIP
jgi:hypothetical protein